MLVENPASGQLKHRDAIKPLKYIYPVDYCQYGATYQKPTIIWSSRELPTFHPCRCPGSRKAGRPDGCKAMIKVLDPESGRTSYKHAKQIKNLSYAQRISIPDQLSFQLASSVLDVLQEHAQTLSKKRKQATSSVGAVPKRSKVSLPMVHQSLLRCLHTPSFLT